MAKTAFIAVSHNQMDGTYLPREVYAILGPTLFKDIKEGQWSYDVNHGKESNKTHLIKVYEGKKAGTTYWSTNCGRDGKKLKKKIFHNLTIIDLLILFSKQLKEKLL